MRLRMGSSQRAAYGLERAAAIEALRAGQHERAWRHLERAHVVAQPFPVAHVGAHVAMLRLGWRLRDRVEVVGQVVRIVAAGPGSAFGRYPRGNTGRARVPLRAEMSVPPDLALLEASS